MPRPLVLLTRRYAVVAVVATWAPCPWAADGQLEENLFFSDLPTVLTASRLPQPLNEAPGAVTVIDREFIKATGYRNLARILRLVPGMQIGQERGGSQWVTYHGLSGTNPSEMQVLIDGRSVYSPANYGSVDWASLPVTVDEIERIEVVRGSNPVTYGANAFLGVINIITRHASDEPVSKLSVAVGAPAVTDLGGSVSGQLGAMSLRMNIQHQHDAGFADLYDSRDMNLLRLRGDYRLSATDELNMHITVGQSEKGLGYADSVNHNNDLRTQYSENYSLHTQWTHAPSAREERTVHFYHNSESISENWTALGNPVLPWYPDGLIVPIDMKRRASRDHLEWQQRQIWDMTLQGVWGIEGRRDEVHAPLLYAGRDSVVTSLFRTFANLEWKFAPKWQLTTGSALEKYDGEPLHVAPRAFLNWQIGPGDTLRAGYARAWAQRPTFEKEGNVKTYEARTGVLVAEPYVGNPDLYQPRVDSVELGYLGRFRPMSGSLDVRLFRERIHGFIYRQAIVSSASPLLDSAEDSAQYVNSANPVTLVGVEYQLKLKPWAGANVMASHTLINTRSVGDTLKYRVAPYSGSLSWQQGWGGGWSSMLTGLRMGPLAGGDGMVPIYGYVGRPYTTFDARIAHAVRVGGHKVEYSFNAINLGERHQEIADRSEQSVLGDYAANRVSPMVYLGLAIEL